MEFGAGASTAEAAHRNIPMISVETDPYYLNAVRKKISPNPTCELIYWNIGLTTKWGYPILKRSQPSWRKYAELPFDRGFSPELILVDGRFRVHCALQAISRLSDFELLFDDYGDRECYRAVEQFAKLDRMYGRMAVFKPKNFDRTALNRAIEQYWQDYR